MLPRVLSLWLLVAALSASAPMAGPAAPAADSDPWTLHRGLNAATELEVVAPDDLWAAGLSEAASNLEATGRWTVHRDPSPGRPRFVFGRLAEPEIERLVLAFAEVNGDLLGFDDDDGFLHGGERYRHDLDALIVTFEDPDRPGLPLTLCAGIGPRALSGRITDLTPVSRPGLTTFRRGQLHRQLALAGRARTDAALERGHLSDVYGLHVRRASGAGYRARVLGGERGAGTPVPDAEVDLGEYGAAVEVARRQVLEWIRAEEGERRAPPARLVVYRDARTWVDLRGGLRLSDAEGATLRAHVWVEESLPNDAGAAAAEVVARAVLGRPARAWIAAAAGVDAADAWWGRSLASWVAYLERGGNSLTVAELLDRGAPRSRSPHRLDPLRAYLFRHLRETRGAAFLRALWRGETDLDIAALEGSFRAALEENARAHDDALEVERTERRASALQPRFRNGIVLQPGTHGLAGRGLQESLRVAAEFGADDLALHVFASPTPYEREFATDPAPRVPFADLTDAEVLRALVLARATGMHTLLQPHRIASGSGGLVGALHLGVPEQIEALFADLGTFLVHYALLAELAECEVLSLGAGLSNATQTGGDLVVPPRAGSDGDGDEEGGASADPTREPSEPNEAESEVDPEDEAQRELRRAGWRAVIARTRASFGGALTYAAQRAGRGWGGEATQFALWPELDFVGIDLFQPLQHFSRSNDPPRRRELERRFQVGVEWCSDLAALVERPLLITSVGYPSTVESWRRPWMNAGEVDLEGQAQIYAVMAASIPALRRAEPGWSGFYLWNWSADPHAGGPRDRGFTPKGKPAQDSLRAILKH